MKRTRVACLVPGRAAGAAETDPRRSAGDRILLVGQDRLGEVAAPPAGLVLVDAVPFSHPVIRWLGRGTPVALTDAAAAAQWTAGEPVVLDAVGRELRAASPDERPAPWTAPPPPEAGRPVRTGDGVAVHLCASIAGASDAARARASGAASIGLVRSEYLVPGDGGAPNEGFYRQAFGAMLRLAAPLALTIRLLDLAGDKWPGWLPRRGAGEALDELHGSQLYAYEPVARVVDAQLAALKGVAETKPLRLIWPSGGRLEDFAARRDRLRASLPPAVRVGAMVETPVELLALREWLGEADFVAIGCNDLLSNLFDADRDNPRQGRLLDPYRPGLYRFLGEACDRAGTGLERVQLCGLLPQVEGVLPVLIGLGLRRFSGEPALIPLLARCVAAGTVRACEELAGAVCRAEDSNAVRQLVGAPTRGPWGLVNEGVPRTAARPRG
jgi:phosphoenolpyruvate-protein kinase (PTS system EI component)